MTITLNVDLGELDHEPEELYALATVANVACGAHAGDDATMKRALGLARAAGTRVAAHPSYPDREGFGRRARFAEGEALARSIDEQLEKLAAIASEAGVRVEAVKPHGALYHDASIDRALGTLVVERAARAFPGAAIVGPEGGALASEAARLGLPYRREGFADRGYDAHGKLVPRGQPGALLHDADACARQAIELARSGRFETLCLHGDAPGALENARRVRAALEAEGLLVARAAG